jgi:hypothetical protein
MCGTVFTAVWAYAGTYWCMRVLTGSLDVFHHGGVRGFTGVQVLDGHLSFGVPPGRVTLVLYEQTQHGVPQRRVRLARLDDDVERRVLVLVSGVPSLGRGGIVLQ